MTHAAPLAPAPKLQVSFELDTPSLAATYDRVGVRQFNHGKLLIADLAPQPGEQVLDVGAGTGLLGNFVAQQVAPHGRVIGIDPLPHRIALASTKEHPNFEARIGRAEDLSEFADASFDVVYLNSVFHWVTDKPKALSEIFRVLKPGGRLGVNSADVENPHQSTALLREAAIRAGIDVDRIPKGFNHGGVSVTQMRALLEHAGFTNFQGNTRTITDTLTDANDLLDWWKSSAFGNAISSYRDDELERLRSELDQGLAPLKTSDGIRLDRYLVFSTATKPAALPEPQ